VRRIAPSPTAAAASHRRDLLGVEFWGVCGGGLVSDESTAPTLSNRLKKH
jgi:hypothetical protein